MIKYRLICKDCNITFDSWFASSSEYEKLKRKNFLNCHSCSSLKIEKTLMSPSVVNKNKFLNEKIQRKKIATIKKNYMNIKNLLEKILNLSEKILLMKQDRSITKIRM